MVIGGGKTRRPRIRYQVARDGVAVEFGSLDPANDSRPDDRRAIWGDALRDRLARLHFEAKGLEPDQARLRTTTCARRRMLPGLGGAEARAEDEDASGEVNPQQQGHDAAEGPIDRVEGGEMPEVDPEQAFRTL